MEAEVFVSKSVIRGGIEVSVLVCYLFNLGRRQVSFRQLDGSDVGVAELNGIEVRAHTNVFNVDVGSVVKRCICEEIKLQELGIVLSVNFAGKELVGLISLCLVLFKVYYEYVPLIIGNKHARRIEVVGSSSAALSGAYEELNGRNGRSVVLGKSVFDNEILTGLCFVSVKYVKVTVGLTGNDGKSCITVHILSGHIYQRSLSCLSQVVKRFAANLDLHSVLFGLGFGLGYLGSGGLGGSLGLYLFAFGGGAFGVVGVIAAGGRSASACRNKLVLISRGGGELDFVKIVVIGLDLFEIVAESKILNVNVYVFAQDLVEDIETEEGCVIQSIVLGFGEGVVVFSGLVSVFKLILLNLFVFGNVDYENVPLIVTNESACRPVMVIVGCALFKGGCVEFERAGCAAILCRAIFDNEVVTGFEYVCLESVEVSGILVGISVESYCVLALKIFYSAKAYCAVCGVEEAFALNNNVDVFVLNRIGYNVGVINRTPATEIVFAGDLEGSCLSVFNFSYEAVREGAVLIVVYHISVVHTNCILIVGVVSGAELEIYPLAVDKLVNLGNGKLVKAVNANSAVVVATLDGELCGLAVGGLEHRNVNGVDYFTVLNRLCSEGILNGVLSYVENVLVGSLAVRAVINGFLRAPRHENCVDGNLIALLKGKLAVIKRYGDNSAKVSNYEIGICLFAADDKLGAVNDKCKIDVSCAVSSVLGHLHIGEIRNVLAEGVVNCIIARHLGINYLGLIVFIKITEKGVYALGVVGSYRIEGEILCEIIEGNVLKNFVGHFVIGSVFVLLRHFHVVVGNLDLTVFGNVIHGNVCICRTVGADNVLGVFAGYEVTVCICVFKEVVSTAAISLFAGEGRGTHRSEVGEGVQVSGGSCGVVGSDTVGLGHRRGEVIVRSAELYPGNLLEGEVTPFIICVYDTVSVNGVLLKNERNNRFTIRGVIDIVNVALARRLAEVFTYFNRNGNQHIGVIDKHRGLNDGGAGIVSHNVDLSIVIRASDGEFYGWVIVLAYSGVSVAEYVDASESIISNVCGVGRGIRGELKELIRNGMSFTLCLVNKFCKIVIGVGVDSLTHIEVVCVICSFNRGRNSAVFNSLGLLDNVVSVLKSYLNGAARVICGKDVSEDTCAGNVKSNVFCACPVNSVDRGVRTLGVLNDNRGNLVGIDLCDHTDLFYVRGCGNCAYLKHVMKLVRVCVKGTRNAESYGKVGGLCNHKLCILNGVIGACRAVKVES